MEARTSSDADYEANYTLYKATLEQCVVSVEGKVYIGCQVLLGNSGNATLIKKNTAVVQFNVRKSVAINNDILVLDTDQTTTDVLESYKNLLENALTTYATKATTYTKTEVDGKLDLKADKSTTYTKTESDVLLDAKADKTTVNELEEDIEFVKNQAKNIDGNYYPKIVAGSIINGVDDDSAWYLTHNGRTPDFYKWEKTISVTANTGTTFFIVAYNENKEYFAISAGQTGRFDFTSTIFNPQPSYFRIAIKNTDSSIIEDDLFHKILFSNTNNILNDIANLKEKDIEINSKINELHQMEVATNISANGIEFETIKKSQKREYIGRNIIAINHDDLTSQDYVDTRKIYNKYEFNANFNFILKPFSDTTEMNNMVENVKKLVSDGNDLGLHAICGSSFWWMNKLYDFRPNYSTTFAPSLSEVATDIGNGKNVFGFPIDATKKFNDVGFKDIPSNYADLLVQSATYSQYIGLLAFYVLYHINLRLVGLDLNGVSRNWTVTYWLEYWYNELIDDTLGYSSSTWFGEYDYQSGGNINDYYPDLEHLKNGKMVFYDDTSNPNYNNSDYQKVGRFNSGLFKGCASCCNYEVEDRCIQIAKAFCKHYFNIDKFTNFGRHGVRYVDCIWYDGVTPYDNREKTILSGEVSKVYISLKQKFMTQHDILLENGIKMTNHYTPLEPIYESQIGLYYGQDGIRYPFFNHTSRELGNTTYLNLFDTASTYTTSIISYADCMKLLDGVDDVIAFAYENAGKQVTSKDGTVTLYVTIYIKTIIDAIRTCKGTGKIPVLSIDTIKNDASSDIAINEFLKWCYNNDYYVVPMEYARKECIKNAREYKQNYFPNPTFKQSLILEYGNVFTSSDALLPDGFAKMNGAYYGSTVDYEVTTENNSKVFTMKAKGNGYTYIQSRMYGLPAGNYTLSFKAKVSDSGVGHIFLTPKKNSDEIKTTFAQMQNHITPTTSWANYSINITISENVINTDDGSVDYSYSKGYEDNISNLLFTMGLSLSNVQDSNYEYELSISDVKLERS